MMRNWAIPFVQLTLLSFCNGEFYIASAPTTMKFISNDDQTLQRRDLPGVINFLMGLPSYDLHRTESWPGLAKIDVFNPPKANILISVHLPKENQFKLNKYAIKYKTDDSIISPVRELNSALVSENDGRNFIKVFSLQPEASYVDASKVRNLDDSLMNRLPWDLQAVNKDNNADTLLFGEIQLLMNAVDSMGKVNPGEKQSIHIILTSLDALAKEYGSVSPQVKEGLKLLEFFIPQFIKAAEDKYKGQLLCEVDVTSGPPAISESLIRHTRQAEEEPTGQATNFTQLNLAEPNSENFAVLFNIILWLMIGFSLAVLAATYTMAYMDPGKDNIIYRVTSQRMKSD